MCSPYWPHRGRERIVGIRKPARRGGSGRRLGGRGCSAEGRQAREDSWVNWSLFQLETRALQSTPFREHGGELRAGGGDIHAAQGPRARRSAQGTQAPRRHLSREVAHTGLGTHPVGGTARGTSAPCQDRASDGLDAVHTPWLPWSQGRKPDGVWSCPRDLEPARPQGRGTSGASGSAVGGAPGHQGDIHGGAAGPGPEGPAGGSGKTQELPSPWRSCHGGQRKTPE